MARVQIDEHGVAVWISARETQEWAQRPGASWPCSQLAGHRVFAAFDRNGLVDMAIDGSSDKDCDITEFNAITCDFLRSKLPKEHPIYFVAVGQFE